MPNYMENSLSTCLRDVLQIMQDRIMTQSTYFGVKTLKCPTDFWVYQEIIYNTKPDIIIEIGNNYGGSTLALAHICDALNKGKIIGLDISHENIPQRVREHERITLISGDACSSFNEVVKIVSQNDRVLIIEDSSHTFDNTLNVLKTYSRLIKPGDYFIVEDGICHHGLSVGPNPGPYEAIEAFVKMNPDFEIDRSKESFLITWNPKGFLKRKK